MDIRHSCDWFQYSAAWGDDVWEWPMLRQDARPYLERVIPHVDTTGWTPERDEDFRVLPMQGYPKTYDMLYCSAHVDPNRREQKIGIRFSAQNLNAYRALGGSEGRLFAFASKSGVSPSRIDIAFDFPGLKVDAMRVYADWKAGRVKCRPRVVQPFTKGVMGEGGKVTEATSVYFGSRESETMVRIYDYAAKHKVEGDWTRVELELKGDKAKTALADFQVHGMEAVGKQILREFITKTPYKFWKELIDGDSIPLTPVGRKMTAHEAWVLNTIVPMLEHDIHCEWESGETGRITYAVEALPRNQWTRRMMELRKTYAWWVDPRSKEIAAD